MKYPDGTDIEPGDIVRIDGAYRGRVIASIDAGRCLPGEEHWAYLGEGVLIDTDFGGLVHCTQASADEILLISRD